MQGKTAYYIIKRRSDHPYPLLKIKGYEKEKMQIEFNNPIPHHPVLADFLSGPELFVSSRIASVIRQFAIDGIKFVPTTLTTPIGKIVEDYTCIIPDNVYAALDKARSVYTCLNGSYTVSEVVLNHDFLKTIPLNKRLIFSLKEAPVYTLFHRMVMDNILKLNPTGMYFQRIDEYKF